MQVPKGTFAAYAEWQDGSQFCCMSFSVVAFTVSGLVFDQVQLKTKAGELGFQ